MAFSYRQVCYAYPTGGGSYSVSKANFGRIASLVAASALLIDYIMTVAVSTTSAVEQIASAVPALYDWKVVIGVAAIGLITLGNLRGLREAGNIFAIPTYLFLGSAFLMIGMGTFRILFMGDTGPTPSPEAVAAMQDTAGSVTILILLRAFASGAVALTGTEAIATGVPAFKPPESKNAARTLMAMAVILGDPVHRHHVPGVELSTSCRPRSRRSSRRSPTTSTATPSASTCSRRSPRCSCSWPRTPSFDAFPRLAAVLGEDGFFPRQFAFRGDRLAYSTGILVLGAVASVVVIIGRRLHARPDPAVRRGRVHRLHHLRSPAWSGTGSRPRTRAGATG